MVSNERRGIDNCLGPCETADPDRGSRVAVLPPVDQSTPQDSEENRDNGHADDIWVPEPFDETTPLVIGDRDMVTGTFAPSEFRVL